MNINEGDIGAAIMGIMGRIDAEYADMSEADIRKRWFYTPREGEPAEIAIYRFYDALSLYARTCRRWEEMHNGSTCVVERVRDKYIMPKIAEFVASWPAPVSDNGRK